MIPLVPCRLITTCASRLNYVGLHPQLSIWSATALCLDICSHVSLVSPTWRQDNGCGPLPPIVWQYRQFVCLLSAVEPSQFTAPAHNDLPSHVTSSIVLLHRHSRFQTATQNITHQFYKICYPTEILIGLYVIVVNKSQRIFITMFVDFCISQSGRQTVRGLGHYYVLA